MKTIIIGRNGNQPFPITAPGVSALHARLTILDDGRWVLSDGDEDGKPSTNGTFVLNDKQEYERIVTRIVDKNTKIRFGCDDTIRSVHVLASVLVYHDPKDPKKYAGEFKMLADKLEDVQKQRNKTERKLDLLSVAPALLSLVLLAVSCGMTDIVHIRIIMCLPGFLSPVLRYIGKHARNKMTKSLKGIFECPNPACHQPLQTTDVEQGLCRHCKAHI